MSKKRKANAVPKRIGGVKVPKALRRGLKELAASETGKAVLTEALMAAGAVLAATQTKPGSKTRKLAAKHAPDLQSIEGGLSDVRAATAERFEAATRTFTETLRRSDSPPLVVAPESAPPAE